MIVTFPSKLASWVFLTTLRIAHYPVFICHYPLRRYQLKVWKGAIIKWKGTSCKSCRSTFPGTFGIPGTLNIKRDYYSFPFVSSPRSFANIVFVWANVILCLSCVVTCSHHLKDYEIISDVSWAAGHVYFTYMLDYSQVHCHFVLTKTLKL